MSRFKPFLGGITARCSITTLLLLVFIASFTVSGAALAEFHGIGITMECSGQPRTCTGPSDCIDSNSCTADECNENIANTLSCRHKANYEDEGEDTISIKAGWQVVDPSGHNTRVPAAAGNLWITEIGGNTTCVVGAFVACTIGPDLGGGDGFVIFEQDVNLTPNAYVIQPSDTSPLLTQGFITVADHCDKTSDIGCDTGDQSPGWQFNTTLQDGCENPPEAPSTACGDTDQNACTTAGCDGAGVCVQEHIVNKCPTPGVCEDSNICNPGTGLCEVKFTPNSTACDDTDGSLCTIAGCDGGGTCNQVHFIPPCPNPGVCEDSNICNPGTGLCEVKYTPDSDACDDTDGDICTIAGCDGGGTCVQKHVESPCVEICRTPGFWATHGGVEKNNATNITQAVIDSVGYLDVCGFMIDNTDADPTAPLNESALEAMCTSPKGIIERQLVRQLTAAALNCVMSGASDGACTGTDRAELLADCNTACTGGISSRSVNDCIDEIDCFNNGGAWDGDHCASGLGYCEGTTIPCDDSGGCGQDVACIPSWETCHDRDLCLQDSNLCWDKPGPAGSSGECKLAKKNDIYYPDSP
jgi:hypothetical protein